MYFSSADGGQNFVWLQYFAELLIVRVLPMHAFKTILLAVTRLHSSELELSQTFRLVSDNNARLIIAVFDQSLDVLQRLQFLPLEGKLEALCRKQLEEYTEELRAKAWEEGVQAETCIVPGKPRQVIGGLINEYGVDLVVKLADPCGPLARNQLTGNDLALLRKCPVPVLMMASRGQLPGFTGNIMVALDVGDPNHDAAELNRNLLLNGLYLSSQEQAQLHIVSVWGLPVEHHALQHFDEEELYELQETTHRRYQKKLDEALDEVTIDKNCPDIHCYLLKGQPAPEIQRLANEVNVDVIVMGTLGHHAQGVLMGNTAENIINNVYCSILAIKPEGFISPLG
ncbi:hypothetical protein GZ77_21840 [Endozoicomonas montiporae]|uniref:UspA domain-containing protein n=3 Tax=Endozoicomonas montiporae TaxID=1027273 RepID=A0A081N3M5_9GAMM|nr:universal stress protein E [Endozoicomonas montiporae CL-33]KEQ13048.1 hypothetical protein GZ77_21840 [Endozoicomonas montiporae]